ncbi:protein LONG AFTER FAR-RED 3-like isoform X2 [Zingiber officinale]|uniref:protein LONG AFTER FAR-RED 3-like isoform X2 n=1 Tax=Zingiber officinale TaxID=94328 RepID=UPI001C4BB62D|nr:protein LONG AFTER FAR-RED 3-like isoform X2 [Zingiber officinale]
MANTVLVLISVVAAAFLAIILAPLRYPEWIPPRWFRISADMVVMNATIYTSDPSLPFAQAMAVRDGRILRVGSYSSIKGLIGHGTSQLNLNGKVVVPGFIDSHVHLLFGGLQMAQVLLRGIKSREEFVRLVQEALRGKDVGEWILGGQWNNDNWGGDLPLSSWIDSITPDNPVWLSRTDGHMGLANSLALKIAGISNRTSDPVGGTIMKNLDGDPSGLLVDSAMKLVLAVIPEVSVKERRDALLRASKYAVSRGVTTVVDMGRFFPGASVHHVWHDFSDVYQWADSSGKMLIRVCLFFPLQTWSRLVDLIQGKGKVFSKWMHFGGVKAFADGSLGSNSALFYEAYDNDPHNYGLQVTDMIWLQNATMHADKCRLQVAIHAIGDKANDILLDMYSNVASYNGLRDRRFRIEHCQHLVPESPKRFGKQLVIASVQPDHLLDDAEPAEKKLGIVRAQSGSYLFKSLFDSNATVAFGSDWPVADINPLGAIRTAIHRVPPGWENAWIPSERTTLDEAMKASTISAAYAAFLDKDLGSLSKAKYADFVVLPANSWDEFLENLPDIVLATYVNGNQVYP